jgi:hypothetical protein
MIPAIGVTLDCAGVSMNLKGWFASLPIWLAAISAFFASLTALSVYQGERYRVEFERLKLTYEVLGRYTEFANRAHDSVACIEALGSLDDQGVQVVLGYEANTIVAPTDAATRRLLLRCLASDGQETSGARIALPENNRLRQFLLSELNQLDALLIAYRYDAGVRSVICENIVAAIKDTVFGEFISTLMRLKIIDGVSRYPNIHAFMVDLGRTARCPAYKAPGLPRNKLLELIEGALPSW